ncbi:MAG: DUF1990 family protein [Sphingobacteriales bacterium]|nr:MAG: DUF1990 family protein [Sphingobacteriales bacterium]
MNYDRSNLKEKVSMTSIDTTKKRTELNTDVIFDYKIFPINIMASLTQWAAEKREMRVGDTIVQQVYIPPYLHFSQKIIFGVRINAIINEPGKIGFSYETLNGHVEKGISIFTLEKTANNASLFKVNTFSQPATFLTQLMGPIFSIPYQTFCTQQALLYVKRQLQPN